jgi:hypothetical protein
VGARRRVQPRSRDHARGDGTVFEPNDVGLRRIDFFFDRDHSKLFSHFSCNFIASTSGFYIVQPNYPIMLQLAIRSYARTPSVLSSLTFFYNINHSSYSENCAITIYFVSFLMLHVF